MEILKTIGYILLALSILIVIHELGHYWAARLFKIRVEKFYLFFDWKFKLFSFKRGDTEWGIGWIPLGGYVKISGMIDESMESDQVQGEPQPWEFRSKPIWQRLIVMLGGIIMNVVLGCLIFICLKYFVGDKEIPIADANKHGLYVADSTFAWEMGFRTGDKILSFDGAAYRSLDAYADPNLLLDEGKSFQIEREGKQMDLAIPDGALNRFAEKKEPGPLFVPDMPAIVMVADTAFLAKVVADNAEKIKKGDTAIFDTTRLLSIQGFRAGLRNFDRIIAVDSTPVNLYSELTTALKGQGNSTHVIRVDRKGTPMEFTVALKQNAKLGVILYTDTLVQNIPYSLGEAIPAGIGAAFTVVVNNVKSLGKLVSGKLNPQKTLSGPVGIANILKKSVDAYGWEGFWRLTAMLSMVLAFMNLLPIPVLDGGHVLILIIEGIIGREIPVKTKMVIMQIGMVMVLALMAFATINDFMK